MGTGGSQSPRVLPISLPTVLLSLKHLACCTGTSELSDPALTGMAAVQTPVLSRMFYYSAIEIGLHQAPPAPRELPGLVTCLDFSPSDLQLLEGWIHISSLP